MLAYTYAHLYSIPWYYWSGNFDASLDIHIASSIYVLAMMHLSSRSKLRIANDSDESDAILIATIM